MWDILGEEIQYGDHMAQSQGKRLPDLVVSRVIKLDWLRGHVITTAGRCKTPSEKLLVVARPTEQIAFPARLQREME